jgi:hypothetical protein
MIELNVTKNECGLQECTATLTLPPITVTRAKADRSDLEYELRRAFEEMVGEIAEKHLKSEF